MNEIVLRFALRKLGYAVDVATYGQQALEKLAQTHYHLVLMDCWLPDLDGWEVTRIFRERETPPDHTIIIALTALSALEDRDRCLAAGMDGYLCKPVSLSDLSRILAFWDPNSAERLEDRETEVSS